MKTRKSSWKILLPVVMLAAALGCQFFTPRAAEAPKAEAAATATVASAQPVTTEVVTTSTSSTPVVTASAVTAQPAAEETSAAPKPTPAPDEIDGLLALRSVRIKLTIDREGEGSRELAAEIDAAGNMRIANTSTGTENNLPDEMYVGFTAVQHEMRVVDGKAYRADGEAKQWASAPGLEDYLERSLRGSEGPGLWIRLLVGGARENRGSEAVGPYTANHFFLSGDVDGKTVSGEIWIDPASGALVQASLEVPGVLYTHSDGGVHDPVVIKLEVQPADVEPVKIP